MAKTSPTQRSLEKLRDAGYTCAVLEHWNAFARRRIDAFGFVDILALRDNEILAVQTTSATNVSARVRKITDHENIAAVRKAGIRVEVWGWVKRKNGRWEVKIVDCS